MRGQENPAGQGCGQLATPGSAPTSRALCRGPAAQAPTPRGGAPAAAPPRVAPRTAPPRCRRIWVAAAAAPYATRRSAGCAAAAQWRCPRLYRAQPERTGRQAGKVPNERLDSALRGQLESSATSQHQPDPDPAGSFTNGACSGALASAIPLSPSRTASRKAGAHLLRPASPPRPVWWCRRPSS